MVDFCSVTCSKPRPISRPAVRAAAVWLGAILLLATWLGTEKVQAQPPVPPPPPPTLPIRVTFTAPAQSPPDQPVTIKAHIQNIGKTAFGKLVLSVDVTAGNSTRLENVNVDSLAVNESRTVPLTLTPRRPGFLSMGSKTCWLEEEKNPELFKKLDHDKLQILVTKEIAYRREGGNIIAYEVVKTTKVISPESVATANVQIKFDAATPVRELLPAAPRANAGKLRLPKSLADVPELSLHDPLARSLKLEETVEHTARMIDRIHHLNRQKTDAFMEALLASRTDLVGLPFAMGDSCRLNDERTRQFAHAVTSMRNARSPRAILGASPTQLSAAPQPAPLNPSSVSVAAGSSAQDPLFEPNPGDALMESFARQCEEAVKNDKRLGSGQAKQALQARVAVAMQVLSAEDPALRLGLVKYLSTLPHVDATRALAQLAIFSEEDDVRGAAVEALKTRRERDCTAVLLHGLSYPWPAVAKRAALAIVQLERNDLLVNLIEVLERPDPRAPRTRDVNGKKVAEVSELVRINHHRNCLLCHAPLDPEFGTSSERAQSLRTLLVQVPQPAEELPAPFAATAVYYGSSNPDILVRVDVTYLRQDFSVKLPVSATQAWPEMQRFDFVVRTRVVSDEEAKAYEKLLQPNEPGVLSPYHRAALFALRELTGRDTEPTAQAWRKVLKL